MEAVYRKCNPLKLNDVPLLLAKYTGAEAKLYAKICKRYHLDPGKFYSDSAAWVTWEKKHQMSVDCSVEKSAAASNRSSGSDPEAKPMIGPPSTGNSEMLSGDADGGFIFDGSAGSSSRASVGAGHLFDHTSESRYSFGGSQFNKNAGLMLREADDSGDRLSATGNSGGSSNEPACVSEPICVADMPDAAVGTGAGKDIGSRVASVEVEPTPEQVIGQTGRAKSFCFSPCPAVPALSSPQTISLFAGGTEASARFSTANSGEIVQASSIFGTSVADGLLGNAGPLGHLRHDQAPPRHSLSSLPTVSTEENEEHNGAATDLTNLATEESRCGLLAEAGMPVHAETKQSKRVGRKRYAKRQQGQKRRKASKAKIVTRKLGSRTFVSKLALRKRRPFEAKQKSRFSTSSGLGQRPIVDPMIMRRPAVVSG